MKLLSGEDVRTGLDAETMRRAILENLNFIQARIPLLATKNDWYMALAYTVRDRMLENWVRSTEGLRRTARAVAYLSAEFLMGPHLGNAMVNLGIWEQTAEAVSLVVSILTSFSRRKPSPAPATGGGKACCLFPRFPGDGKIHALGYGIRYEFGIFDQEIVDGWPRRDNGQEAGPRQSWEIARPEITTTCSSGGVPSSTTTKGDAIVSAGFLTGS